MKNLTFGLECTTSKKCNIHIFKTMSSNISVYNQKKCVLCCDNFKSDVIILPCKHIFDLKCLMTYVKFNYLEKKKIRKFGALDREMTLTLHFVCVTPRVVQEARLMSAWALPVSCSLAYPA